MTQITNFNKIVTSEQFLSYLESLGLFRWKLTQNINGFEAILPENSYPNISDFTQVLKNADGTWFVRLSKSDFYNNLITKGFFK